MLNEHICSKYEIMRLINIKSVGIVYQYIRAGMPCIIGEDGKRYFDVNKAFLWVASKRIKKSIEDIEAGGLHAAEMAFVMGLTKSRVKNWMVTGGIPRDQFYTELYVPKMGRAICTTMNKVLLPEGIIWILNQRLRRNLL